MLRLTEYELSFLMLCMRAEHLLHLQAICARVRRIAPGQRKRLSLSLSDIGLCKFHHCMYWGSFACTDHLLAIFDSKKGIPFLAAARMTFYSQLISMR